MARTKRKGGLRWVFAGALIVVLGFLSFRGLSLLRSSPPPPPQRPVVKVMPPAPPYAPAFLKAEEEGLKILSQAEEKRPFQIAKPRTSQMEDAKSPPPPASQSAPPSPSPKQAPVPSASPLETPPPAVQPNAPPPTPSSEPRIKEKGEAFAYTIHLESFKSPKTARDRVRYFESLGLEAFSRRVDLPGKGVFHRVLVGRFADRTQAKAFQASLQEDHSLPRGRIISASAVDR